ncbi:MAG: LamG-like jellyroll fold domain-containing protein, partial [Melioribacteraceae bacterium]|nr:LamG-like jellyroll fold domain-containing protein [Melioribacteraceae bacterium]
MRITLGLVFILTLYHTPCYTQNLEDSLIAHYTFDSNAEDSSRNQLDGTVYQASLTNDRFLNDSSAYFFNGIDSYIDLSKNQLLKPNFPISISVWFMKHNDEQGWIFCNNLDSINYYGVFLGFGDSNKISLHYGNGMQIGRLYSRRSIYSVQSVELAKWYHAVGIIESPENMILYLNGKEIDVINSGTADELAYNDGIACIGKFHNWQNQNARYFNGIIDDFRLYNKALTKNEIEILHQEKFGFVDFSADVLQGMEPLTVNFKNESILNNSLTNYSWKWDFNDDGKIDSEEINPTWTYIERGLYSVNLMVTDSIFG